MENLEKCNSPRCMKPLDKNVVQKICSGQIITTLAVAVKELIENSLDAGAKTVEVRFKDFGSTLIEVRDDGTGIDRQNRHVFALKNYTSKINDFSDIYDLNTFGFRGEAINSLCAIAEISVITRYEDDNCGTFLEFDRSGNIINEKPHARMVGTTVFVKNIFSSLPVRRKLLLGNLKKEYAKAVDMIKAYCLVTIGARIIFSNQIGEKSPMNVFLSDGTSVLDNISSTFGVDQAKNLLPIPRFLPDKTMLEELRILEESESNEVYFDGYISSCTRGEGRNLRDRQFIYINSRPCDYDRIIRVINSVFHQYQKHRYPFLFLNLKLSNDAVDVNCSPDKREVILRNEKLVVATIKASLLGLFRSVQTVSTIENNKLPAVQFKLDSSFLKFKNDDQASGKKSVGEKTSALKMCLEEKSGLSRSLIPAINEQNEIVQKEVMEVSSTINHSVVKKDDTTIVPQHQREHGAGCYIVGENGQGKRIVIDDNKKCYNRNRIQNIIDVGSLLINPNLHREDSLQTFVENERKILKFRAALDPSQNENAEKELCQQITGEMFSKMEIVGQLNKSFIVVHLDSDLFVIDQHAADEIYNFETLMKSSSLQNQRLVVPQSLDLLPNQEVIITEYLSVFKRNGFEFSINDSAPPSQRIQLTAVPISKLWNYGREDVIELIAKLEECPDLNARPSRIRAMFASRACRKSIMMGSSLTKSNMRKVVDNLGNLDEPWNCPHGRPTMRHLFDLNQMKQNYINLLEPPSVG